MNNQDDIQEQDSTDQYRNLINQAFNEANQNNVGPEVYLELLELVTARVVDSMS